MSTIAKTTDGTIVEIVRAVESVDFSDEKGWIFVCFDFHRDYAKRSSFKWIRSSTSFVWARDFI
jgi:hypothetical protein